jgi:hypothetical protein
VKEVRMLEMMVLFILARLEDLDVDDGLDSQLTF